MILAGAGLIVTGFGMATWDVAQNVEAADVEQRLGRTLMPRFHAGFSIGTVAGALAGAGCARLGVRCAGAVDRHRGAGGDHGHRRRPLVPPGPGARGGRGAHLRADAAGVAGAADVADRPAGAQLRLHRRGGQRLVDGRLRRRSRHQRHPRRAGLRRLRHGHDGVPAGRGQARWSAGDARAVLRVTAGDRRRRPAAGGVRTVAALGGGRRAAVGSGRGARLPGRDERSRRRSGFVPPDGCRWSHRSVTPRSWPDHRSSASSRRRPASCARCSWCSGRSPWHC